MTEGATQNVGMIKTDAEINLMRDSGKLLAQVFRMLDDFICEGITTLEIDARVEDYCECFECSTCE
jgi:methionyl aminopeptidase